MSRKQKSASKPKGEPVARTRPPQASKLQPKVKQARLKNRKGGASGR